MIFELAFWCRRRDDDYVDCHYPPLHDPDNPPPFRYEELKEIRDADGDKDNRDAPWWDVGVKATVEAPCAEEAWHLVELHLPVVQRQSLVESGQKDGQTKSKGGP